MSKRKSKRKRGTLGLALPGTDARTLHWRGPVVRRDPATYRQQSVHETWRCPNCRQFTMGAFETGRCNWCDEPRPPTGRDVWAS